MFIFMNKFNKLSTILAVVFLLVAFCGSQSRAESTSEITIGAILPLTGDAASWGEAVRNGIELARSKLAPELKARIRVVYEDDQRKPALAVAAFQKLLKVDGVSAIIGITAQPGLAIAPLAEQHRIPFISIAVPKQISAGRKYTVLFYATAERMAAALVEESNRRSYRRIARISSIHDGRFAMRTEFDKAAGGNFEIVLDEEYPIESRDFRPFLTKLKNLQSVDAIYVNLVLGQAGIFARQARELGIALPLFESEMFEDESEVRLSNGALIGQWFVNQASPSQEFEQEYFKRFPGSKIFNALNGHDALLLLGKAIEANANREAINTFLHRPEGFSGVLGRYRLDDSNRFDLPVAVKEVKERGFLTLR